MEESLSLSVSAMPRTWVDFVDALRRRLLSDPLGRSRLPPAGAAAALHELREGLSRLLDESGESIVRD